MPEARIDQAPTQCSVPTVTFTLRPIGIVHAPPRRRGRLPKYFVPKGQATLELFQPYMAGLQGLYEGLDLWIITYSAPSGRDVGTDGALGVFATDAMERPNPIEFLRAKVVSHSPETGQLHVEGMDAEDGAPILDIRPAQSPLHRLARSAK